MNDLQNKLIQIGFTEYEAKVYLALLKEHPVSGYQVSKTSGVPRSMVYEVLSRLRARGAVLETIEDRATFYRPLAPEVLLTHYEDKMQTLLTELRPGLTDLYQATQDDRLWSITGQSAILIYCQQMLHKAEKEVYLVLNDQMVEKFTPWLEKLTEKNISIHILQTGTKPLEVGEVSYHPPLESELQGMTDLLLLIVDQEEVLISGSGFEARATITANPNTILIAHQFVWMEIFTQRIYQQIGPDLLQNLTTEDRQIFESLTNHRSES